jgi:hypothetical protein
VAIVLVIVFLVVGPVLLLFVNERRAALTSLERPIEAIRRIPSKRGRPGDQFRGRSRTGRLPVLRNR